MSKEFPSSDSGEDDEVVGGLGAARDGDAPDLDKLLDKAEYVLSSAEEKKRKRDEGKK